VLASYRVLYLLYMGPSKIKNNLDYLDAFIDILLVSGKNPCSLAAKV